MKGSRFLRKKKAPGLMLTSLLDMFTIILIFLIVSFDAENQEVRLRSELELPESTARAPFRPAVNLAIADDAVYLGEERVAGLGARDDIDIPDLVTALEREYAIRFGAPADNPAPTPGADGEDDETGPIVLIQADRELAYRTLYRILRSAAQAGFFRYRLAVMKT